MEVVWAESARREFDAAIAFINAESPSGARRIGERILAAVALLEHFPEIAPASPRHRNLRQLAAPRTPYLVIYRVHANRVEIRAIVHAKQRRRK
ncbi:MAG TPA: type II toxin-antitoxin system RelE/ParE family toxin [Vitreimonas sp.]|uniref:type II toxin-antitoxin system RelE/ParE family toxin n=1 Tax=Vitreimonas sp. TaxID=3069702 RepID=UPI002D49A38F|nr:type II toxin-antitoxin system RelE/ParE family toxin [Vitreimonas sp.]HYD87367.1 type II toxin-antitoxin system RelE/ParE family toxin [Vitreimonas sp.]